MKTSPSLKRFHASRHEFDFPDYEKMNANQTGHDNGLLGLWVSVRSDWIESFGGNIYEMEIQGKVAQLNLRELSSWASEHQNSLDFYRQKRMEFLDKGISYIALIEKDGESEMGIVVDFGSIKNFQRMENSIKKTMKGPSL